MGPMVEAGVEVAALIPDMDSHPARVTTSRAMEATARALTAARAPTTREDMAAMVKPNQVETDSAQNHSLTAVQFTSAPCSNSTPFVGGYTSPSSNQGGGGYSHSSQSYNSGGYNNNQPPNMSYNQQSSFSGYSQQQPPPSSSSGFDIIFFFLCVVNQIYFQKCCQG